MQVKKSIRLKEKGMGIVKVNVKFMNPFTKVGINVESMVDTGATYTVIPLKLQEELKLPLSGRRLKVKTAKGEDELEEAMAIAEFAEEKGFTTVLISKHIDVPLIGALTLEGFGYKVDPITGKLEKTPIYLLAYVTLHSSYFLKTKLGSLL